MTGPCLFCAIAAGTAPADVLSCDEHTVTFADSSPVAPIHLLVIPRAHVPTVVELAARPRLAAAVLAAVAAAGARVGASNFRTVFNTGVQGGQHVWHVHAHVLAGRTMTWPPG
jgi:histidine triad (HIT) family protein